jgi:8-oxo-dGTP pyrophosphatase MutT (NUDIX family)
MTTEIVSREERYDGKNFSVFQYKCNVNGKTVVRDIIERRDGVVIVAIDADMQVLMLREYCAGSNSFILSFPGGSIDPTDHDTSAAANRELREETGYASGRIEKLRFAYSHPSTSTRRSYVFLALDLRPDPVPASNEIIEVQRMPLADAITSCYTAFESDVSTIGNLLMARDRLRDLGVTRTTTP